MSDDEEVGMTLLDIFYHASLLPLSNYMFFGTPSLLSFQFFIIIVFF